MNTEETAKHIENKIRGINNATWLAWDGSAHDSS